jgi:hypothetical protein
MTQGYDSEGTPLYEESYACPDGHIWSWMGYTLPPGDFAYTCICGLKGEPTPSPESGT